MMDSCWIKLECLDMEKRKQCVCEGLEVNEGWINWFGEN